jgi:molecular chaperone HtpG
MTTTTETLAFQAETRQLLDIVIHSLYSHKEIFLRELISNASDALDKLKFEALSDSQLLGDDPALEIRVDADATTRILTISDSGIGMSRDELVSNIGTIAKSGTRELMEKLKAAPASDTLTSLIGQFGVGFYSSFMVADRVEIVTRKAGAETATRWESTGDGTYKISEGSRFRRGTDVILHLKPADPDNGLQNYADPYVLRSLIKKHSDFVAFPVLLKDTDKDGATQWATVNSMKPIWTLPASEVTDESYNEFYRHLSHDWTDPLDRLLLKAEGRLEYHALLYLPSKAPFDLYYRDQDYGLQLHVRRVLIMDRCRALLPLFLRFVRGVVDSADLPLNLSREMVQQDRHITQMRGWLTRKVLDHLKDVLTTKRDTYLAFWGEFGNVLKEGVGYDAEHRERLSKLMLFESTHDSRALSSFADYVARMPEGQDAIYYIAGESRTVVEHSPHLEAFKAKGYEVLFFVDSIDEFFAQSISEAEGKTLVSVARAGVELGTEDERQKAEEARKAQEEDLRGFLKFLESTLAESIKEARVSSRLTSSPACLVAGEHDLSPGLERMLRRASGKEDGGEAKRILEVNAGHELVQKLRARHAAAPDDTAVADYAHLLLGSALLAEGASLPDPAKFATMLTDLMSKGL